MTAQIISLSAYRPQTGTPCPKLVRGRGLALSAKQAAILARLNRGEVITDIGQIDEPTKRLLKRFLDKGYVYRGVDYTFPKDKTCWVGAAYDTAETPLPMNYKFREL